jgi:hypothetical protein
VCRTESPLGQISNLDSGEVEQGGFSLPFREGVCALIILQGDLCRPAVPNLPRVRGSPAGLIPGRADYCGRACATAGPRLLLPPDLVLVILHCTNPLDTLLPSTPGTRPRPAETRPGRPGRALSPDSRGCRPAACGGGGAGGVRVRPRPGGG